MARALHGRLDDRKWPSRATEWCKLVAGNLPFGCTLRPEFRAQRDGLLVLRVARYLPVRADGIANGLNLRAGVGQPLTSPAARHRQLQGLALHRPKDEPRNRFAPAPNRLQRKEAAYRCTPTVRPKPSQRGIVSGGAARLPPHFRRLDCCQVPPTCLTFG